MVTSTDCSDFLTAVEPVLARISFKLKKQSTGAKLLQKKTFPVSVPPKSHHVYKVNPPTITFTNSTGIAESAYVYAPHNNVSRPRNKFIIARTILNKVVKRKHDGTTYDVSRIISKIWSSGIGSFQNYFDYLSFLDAEWHDCYYPLYHYNPKGRSSALKAVGGTPAARLNPKGRSSALKAVGGTPAARLPDQNVSVVLLNDPENKMQQKAQTKPSIRKNATDIMDMTNYVELCASSFEEGVPMLKPEPDSPINSSTRYKDHTLTFSIRGTCKNPKIQGRVTKQRKKITSKKTPSGSTPMNLLFSKFQSPLYGEVEDIYINQSSS